MANDPIRIGGSAYLQRYCNCDRVIATRSRSDSSRLTRQLQSRTESFVERQRREEEEEEEGGSILRRRDGRESANTLPFDNTSRWIGFLLVEQFHPGYYIHPFFAAASSFLPLAPFLPPPSLSSPIPPPPLNSRATLELPARVFVSIFPASRKNCNCMKHVAPPRVPWSRANLPAISIYLLIDSLQWNLASRVDDIRRFTHRSNIRVICYGGDAFTCGICRVTSRLCSRENKSRSIFSTSRS